MPVTEALPPDQAPEATRQVFEKIKQAEGKDQVPIEFQMMGHVPAFAGDAFANQQKYLNDGNTVLTLAQREALALATSSANDCKSCVRAHVKACQDAGWSETEVAEILAVAANAAMYNTFYKFQHGVSDEALSQTKPMLRAHTWRNTSLDDGLVELIAVIVSVINSCDYCIDAHTQKALDAGVPREQLQEAMRLSSMMTAFNAYFRIQ
jgi:alkyl hydroperoxide reductase subunit D